MSDVDVLAGESVVVFEAKDVFASALDSIRGGSVLNLRGSRPSSPTQRHPVSIGPSPSFGLPFHGLRAIGGLLRVERERGIGIGGRRLESTDKRKQTSDNIRDGSVRLSPFDQPPASAPFHPHPRPRGSD